MSTIIEQESLTQLEIAQASSGNVVISQESVNDDSTSIVVEQKALPELIEALKRYVK